MQQWFLERLNFQLALHAPVPFILFSLAGIVIGFVAAKFMYAREIAGFVQERTVLEQRVKQAQEALAIAESKQGFKIYEKGEPPLIIRP